MIINRQIAIKPLEDGNCAKKKLERFYVQNCFKNHMNNVNQPYVKNRRSIPKNDSRITSQVIEHIDKLFNLPQLYCIFYACNEEIGGWNFNYALISEYKTHVVKYVNEFAEEFNDLGDIEKFKKNLADLNPIIFNVLNDLFYESQIFDEDNFDGYRYPKISEDENECQTELEELIWTYNALERIEDICNKFYKIDDRVAALTDEGYDIKPCWVGSGGVSSTFYMYNKKEIRIQIAASKFKGSGNSKSKSALCAVIPYPSFLHKNRIREWD